MKQTTKTVRSSLGTVEFSAAVACLLLSMISSLAFAGDKPGVGVERAVLPVAGQSVKTFVVDRSVPEKKRWLQHAGFGLMFHYEVFKNHSTASYNRAIDSFNVVRFADAVESTRAGYVIFTVGQHWGKFCAPNAAYERLLGVKPGVWTSRRDLVMEIARELHRRKIRLILYMTARAPMRHYRVIKATGDALPTINGKPAGPGVDTMSHPRKVKGFRRSENQPPPSVFLRNWGAVCGEWSRRYGPLVSGWWFDGYKTEMKDAYQGLKKQTFNIDTWIAAVRSGNPDAELAFNAGAHPILSLCTRGRLCPHQTFTSGENRDFYQRTKKGRGKLLTPENFPAPEGVVWHLLLPVSKGWGAGVKSRFDVETLKSRVDLIDSQGGVVTLDVPVSPEGTIPREVLGVLQKMGQDIRKLRDGARSF
ncbi:MAG: alpha-L-fucosidase [Planctomycetota bacterium]|nr:alpha-L-fucosidase [Planctomycetota bacterium]